MALGKPFSRPHCWGWWVLGAIVFVNVIAIAWSEMEKQRRASGAKP